MTTFKGQHGPLLIAEIGGNHEGNFEYAKKLVRLAIDSGVDCIKLQIYTGDSLVSSVESPDRNAHFKKFELTNDQHIELARMIRNAGIKYTSSVWDTSALDWIDEYMDIYKIGSGDLTAYPVIRDIVKKKKPIILSTGLSTANEVIDCVDYIRKLDKHYHHPQMLAVLQCTSMYPIKASDANLQVMNSLKKMTQATVGYSDHTEGFKALFYASAMGADILEFHFTDTREGKVFRDHKVSLTPDEINILKGELHLIQELRGNEEKEPLAIEQDTGHVISFRRAVYPSRDLLAGEVLTDENLTTLRPNHGIDARSYDQLIGRKVASNVKKHQKLDWNLII